MATLLNPTFPRATSRANATISSTPLFLYTKEPTFRFKQFVRIKALSGGGDSYLDMWKKAVDRERKSIEFERIAENTGELGEEGSEEDLEKMNSQFEKLLEIPPEERDRVQRMQVIDRAAAAIAAARALLKEGKTVLPQEEDVEVGRLEVEEKKDDQQGMQKASTLLPQSGTSIIATPGPNFWAWIPPPNENDFSDDSETKPTSKASSSPLNTIPVLEKERNLDVLSIPFHSSSIENKINLPLPPLQSHVEVEKSDDSAPHLVEENERGVQFSAHAFEAAEALSKADESLPEGVNIDGSRWWKETGIDQRPDGVVCKWTLTRSVSADKSIEWEDKYWEAADELGYKELGSEKSGRDAAGNVWREYWRESMIQVDGVVHIEKTADKWGKNTQGGEWQEQWWEHYGDGKAEKWAHKWCSIDPFTPLDDGHAHVWHERWGEKYDGQGGSMKYTDKWAERFEGDGWAKWGDKWDENFDPNGEGVKQGETWWQGKQGDRWNRTWGEGHNGSGWVHKYGKSSSGEHWDTHVPMETWYEKFPHYGFYHCFENSVPLRGVQKPSEWS